jgi:transposase
MDLVLEASARKEILLRRRYALDKRVANRLSAVLWVADGRTRLEVAGLLGVSARQVRNWLRLYRNEGLDALCALRFTGDPGGLRPAQVKRL